MTAPKEIEVTDHAILRWLERLMGVDVEAARAAIIREAGRAPQAACALDNTGRYKVLGAKAELVMREHVVVTVMKRRSFVKGRPE